MENTNSMTNETVKKMWLDIKDYNIIIFCISIYTLSDLGDLSNLIGSLSRTIQQYSPPSEWIMYEL